LFALLLLSARAAIALQAPERGGRFDALVVEDPRSSPDVASMSEAALPASDRARIGWEQFRAAHGQEWRVHLDRRSGAPLLVEGSGIPWAVSERASVQAIATSLRTFIAGNRGVFLADDDELVLDADASGLLTPDVSQVVFKRVVAGVPVAGERYVFTIGRGRLVSFGTPRWSRIDTSPVPDLDAVKAQERLSTYMGLTAGDTVEVVFPPTLELIALRAAGPPTGAGHGPFAGKLGDGYSSALVWRVALRVAGEPGTWLALVDAHTGAIRSFTDDNQYARVKGGVYPVSGDHLCPDGCEQPNYPMPFADVTIGGNAATASSMGKFSCTPGGSSATTTLAGPYVKVVDTCGPISRTVTCDTNLDLSQSAGTDCAVPAGGSAGNTHAARTSYYHLNRIAEHARSWLPTNPWLSSQLTDNVNINSVCNAYWNHTSVNFFKSGAICNNTGEIAGVFLHEWGHGLDENDGGDLENPSEAYADITTFLSMHDSCMGRGFKKFGTCGGYGDACLTCTGVRDQDWDKRASHTPATPAGFVTTHCASGSGPCGKEVHCESYVAAEAVWDLATRDLPATGLDLASSWQLVDKLWYKSRLGSSGTAYNCSLPASDGCNVDAWFQKLRTIDDDDGNPANGTPHAGAIFAAFDRHKIACGSTGNGFNQTSTICPAIGATTLTAAAGAAAAQLSWTAAAGATAYNVLRNEASCAAGFTIIAIVPGTTFTDSDLAEGFTEFYRVQPVGANPACDGRVSNCQSVAPQSSFGEVKLDSTSYACSSPIGVTVNDANIGTATTTVAIASTTEPAGETITLTRISPGSATYAGTLNATSAAPAPDGLISVAHGATITATYIDANDGQGGFNVTRQTTATVDCALPIISNVAAGNLTSSSARISWDTSEAATGVVHYGLSPPPASTAGIPAMGVSHAVDLTGLTACTSYLYSIESADAPGNTALDNAAGAYYRFATGKNVTYDYLSADTPVPIPDNRVAVATSTIVVPDNTPVQKVTVTVNITHPFDADLVLTLAPPVDTQFTLSNQRSPFGGANFIDTVFDDAAPTSIAAGTPPFTGSFRPETPLSPLNGINAAGAWQLRVLDSASGDTGTIVNWTLSLTLPVPCGPEYQSHALVTDTCTTGGPGNGDGTWDAGERETFEISIYNEGPNTLTGVSATITSTTPGVVMIDGTASYPDIPPASSAESLAPHFTAQLPASLACGSSVALQMSITSNEAAGTGSFNRGVGLVTPSAGTVLDENFSGGIPGTWTVVDGGSGGGAASTWTTANPGGRSIAAPMAAPTAIVDSFSAGAAAQNEELITPALNLSIATAVTLQFDQNFRWYSQGQNEVADVDVRSSRTAGVWVNVLRQQGTSSPDPDHKTLDISSQAAGASNLQVRFHYYNAMGDFWWQIDNVKIAFTATPGCAQTVCAAAPGVARPVADGSFGTAMTAARAGVSSSTIDLTWDVSTCSSTDHHVLYGDLASVASATVGGAACHLGASGLASWSGVPAGDLWFVVVGDDDAFIEGSWGTRGDGAQRGGNAPSAVCGMTTRDNSGTCP
jgi:subtilisin-like proprotein convertase family protein